MLRQTVLALRPELTEITSRSRANVQTLTVGYKSETEIEQGFTSVTTQDIAAGASGGLDVSIVLHADDVVEGRTYRLESTGGSGGTNIDVSYTAVSGDTKLQVMEGLRDALLIFDEDIFLGAASTTVDVSTTSGTLKIDAALDFGDATFEFGISENNINNALGAAATYNARLKRLGIEPANQNRP